MPEVGQNLGRYTLLKKLAVGGMGEIYLAARAGPLGFAPPVALKVLKDEFASDRQFVDMLIDEANISRFLNHQNVVSVLDFGESDKTYYIAMEYVQGLTLKQLLDGIRLRKKPLELSVALYVAIELCRALKYAHTRNNHAGEPLNIVHRDVTPGNVLLSIQGEVKLTDFGIARARGRSHQTQAGVLKGKFGYMAPEMIRYEAIDARADLFCAGVVIYEMVAGCHPVEGAAIMEAIQRFEERRIDPPSKFNSAVPKALDVILLRALEPKTSDRWASATALGNALQDLALQNTALRGEMKNASSRLVDLMRELEPSVFEQPVPRDALDRLLEVGRRAEQDARANLESATEASPPAESPRKPTGPMRPDSIPPPDDAPYSFRPTVGDHSSGMAAMNVDSIPPTFIPSNRSAVAAIQPAPKVKSSRVTFNDDELETKLDPAELAPVEPALDEVATLAMPAINRADYAPDPKIRFPDTSTDRANLHADLLAEPRLPGGDASGPQPAVKREDLDDRTIAMGMMIPDYDSVPDGRSPSSASGPIQVGNLEADTDEDKKFEEPKLVAPRRGGSVATYLDDKTAYSPSGFGLDDEAPTILPSDDLLQTADRTLLEVPDVRDALMQAAVKVRDHDAGEEDEPELPMTARGREMSASYLDDRTVAGVISTEEPEQRPSIEGLGADFKIPGDPTAIGVVSDDISVDRTLLGVISEPPPATVSAAPAAKAKATRVLPDPDSVDAFSSAPRPNVGKNGPRLGTLEAPVGMPAPGSPPAAAGNAPSSVHRPRVPLMPDAVPLAPKVAPTPQPARTSASATSNLVPGAQTAQWMAGQLPATSLSWDDDEAARRLVATRNTAAPASSTVRPATSAVSGSRAFPPAGASAPQTPLLGPQNVIAPAMTSAYPRPQAPSAEHSSGGARPSLPLILALVLLFVSVFGLVGMTFFTKVFWPRLAVTSEPPGAEVQVDGRVYGATPLKLKLKPNAPHAIELRLAGYPRHVVPALSLALFAEETVTHRFERQERRLYIAPVAGTVFVNDKEAGSGVEVLLPADLDPEAPATIRVEAAGYKPWERKLPRLADVGKSLDVPLEPLEPPTDEKPPSDG